MTETEVTPPVQGAVPAKPVRFCVDIAPQVKTAILEVLSYCIETNSANSLIANVFLKLRTEARRSGPFHAQQLYVLSEAECQVIDKMRRKR